MFRNTSDDDRGHRRDRDFDASRGGDRRDERPHAGGFNTRTYSSADARKQEYGRMGPSDRRSESFGRAADRRPDRPSSLNYSRGDSRPTDNRRRDLETSGSSRLSLSGLMPLPKTTAVDHKEVRFFLSASWRLLFPPAREKFGAKNFIFGCQIESGANLPFFYM
jgi:hypothetical protein